MTYQQMYPLNAGKHTPSNYSLGESSVSFISKSNTVDIEVARKDFVGVSSMLKQYPDNQAQAGTFINAEHMHTDTCTRTRT